MHAHCKRFVFATVLLLISFLLGCGDTALPPVSPDQPLDLVCPNVGVAAETAPEIAENLTPYSFVWMSDTQLYSQGKPKSYLKITNWIVNNIERLNLQYVFHTGDVVHRKNEPEQWINADNAMKVLDGIIPYSVLAGNHDVGWKGAETEYKNYYLKYFSKDRFENSQNRREYYKDGMATAEWITVGETKFLILALGYHLPNNGLYQWANDILAQNRDCIAILSTHEYLHVDATHTDAGERLFKNVVKKNPNVHMVLCGHNHYSNRAIQPIDDDGDGTIDRNVIEMIADYQTVGNGGDGYIRILTIHESTRTLEVTTYSPVLDDYDCYTDAPDQDTFTLSIADWFAHP